jgi:ribonuclease HII
VWEFETDARRQGFKTIAGIDEAGRGPLAGPVVSAAVILAVDFPPDAVADSKTLTPKTRDRLYDHIYANARAVGIGIVDPIEIDRINILKASLLSMAIAVSNLRPQPDYLLIDGPYRIDSPILQEPIKGGDGRSLSIAAASIVAKVTRDRLMAGYHLDYPQFDFPTHKGYPTRAHREAIARFGTCPIHRKSFRGARER